MEFAWVSIYIHVWHKSPVEKGKRRPTLQWNHGRALGSKYMHLKISKEKKNLIDMDFLLSIKMNITKL